MNRADKYFDLVLSNFGPCFAYQNIVMLVAFEDCFLVVEVAEVEVDEGIVVCVAIAD